MDDDEDIIYTYIRGHVVFSPDDGESWVWEDTQEPVTEKLVGDPDSRPCARCGLPPNEDGHDYCCQRLPGVRNACCGHGTEYPYIQFQDDVTFKDVVNFLKHRNEYQHIALRFKGDSSVGQ